MKKERYNPEDYKKPKREVYDTESNNGGVKRVCKKYRIGFYKNPYGSSAYFDDVHNIDRFCKAADNNGWDPDNTVVKLLKDAAMKLKHASYAESKEIVNRLNKRLITMFPTKAEKEALKEAIRIAKAKAAIEKQRKELSENLIHEAINATPVPSSMIMGAMSELEKESADIGNTEMKGENDVIV